MREVRAAVVAEWVMETEAGRIAITEIINGVPGVRFDTDDAAAATRYIEDRRKAVSDQVFALASDRN